MVICGCLQRSFFFNPPPFPSAPSTLFLHFTQFVSKKMPTAHTAGVFTVRDSLKQEIHKCKYHAVKHHRLESKIYNGERAINYPRRGKKETVENIVGAGGEILHRYLHKVQSLNNFGYISGNTEHNNLITKTTDKSSILHENSWIFCVLGPKASG